MRARPLARGRRNSPSRARRDNARDHPHRRYHASVHTPVSVTAKTGATVIWVNTDRPAPCHIACSTLRMVATVVAE